MKGKTPGVNDTARGMPLTDATAAATAMDMIGRQQRGEPPPTACCPRDDEPLICTMQFPGAEFVCMVCGALLGWLAPTPKASTPELDARYDELLARWDAGEAPPGRSPKNGTKVDA